MTPKTYWITGASTGIGAALAQRLAKAGHTVAVSARSADKLDALAAGGYGAGRIESFPLDLTDRAAVTRTVAAIRDRFGRIDCAVLNAGTYTPDTLATFDPVVLADHFELNVVGTMNTFAALLPVMQAGGQIAVVASVAGYRGLPGGVSYGATKAALINIAEALQPECAMRHIKLQLICPGFVKTRLTDKNTFPMPFLLSADEAAAAIERGLEQSGFEIVFPWPMKLAMKLLRVMPYPLFFAITRHLVRQVEPGT